MGQAFKLVCEPRLPRDDLLHLAAPALHEFIRVRLKPRNALLLGEAILRGIGIEARNDHVQFVNRAAQSLAILLGIFGQLRTHNGADHREEKRQPSEEHDHEVRA